MNLTEARRATHIVALHRVEARMADASPLNDDDRIIAFRDCATAAGCSERTLETKLKAAGICVVKVSPRQKGMRLSQFRAFIRSCEVAA